MQNQLLGRQGEQLAYTHLVNKGYHILERNWRFGKEELDIIAKKDELIVFVEVKTRDNDFLGDPVEAVTPGKQRTIIKVANEYLLKNNIELESRFDIIGIIHNHSQTKLEHVEDAFFPTAY